MVQHLPPPPPPPLLLLRLRHLLVDPPLWLHHPLLLMENSRELELLSLLLHRLLHLRRLLFLHTRRLFCQLLSLRRDSR